VGTDRAGATGGPTGPAGPPATLGRLIAGRYRLAGLIGTGAMGAVWLARDELLDVDVAVKEIRPPFAFSGPDDRSAGTEIPGWLEPGLDEAGYADPTEAWVSRALREARNAARLRANPHVVTVHDAVVDDGKPWIVMEAVPARSLQEAVADDGPLPLADVARIGLAVLDALVAAHRLGVVHRDVKPSNILLAHDGRVLLTDFGIAASDADPTLTQPTDGDLPTGTPAYIAPERLLGGPTTLAADLFALGATLLFAADGVAPFHRDSVLLSLQAVVSSEPEPSRDLGPLGPAISGLLLKDPTVRLRPDGAGALFVRALRTLGADDPGPSWPSRELGASPSAPTMAGAGAGSRALPRPRGPANDGTTMRPPTGPPAPAEYPPGEALAASAAPLPPGKLGPDTLSGPGGVAPWRARSLPVPVPVGLLVFVVVLALVGLAAWWVGAARAGHDRAGAGQSGAGATTGPAAATPGGAPGARSGAVPAEMVGEWRGTVTQGTVQFGVVLEIRGGALDAAIGESRSSEGCVADLVLRDTGVSTITVQEDLTQSDQRCIGVFRLLLTLNSNGTLGYFYDPTLVTSAGLATLTRTSATPSPS